VRRALWQGVEFVGVGVGVVIDDIDILLDVRCLARAHGN
jgi:hypothetical protein